MELKAARGCVGIFWGIPLISGNLRRFTVVIDRTNLDEAEPYDRFLTHPRGHYDVWEAWKRLGFSGLKRRGLPDAIAWSEYEDFPRGRIVYDTQAARFTVYADRRLQAGEALADIITAFGLLEADYIVASDPHYRSRPIQG